MLSKLIYFEHASTSRFEHFVSKTFQQISTCLNVKTSSKLLMCSKPVAYRYKNCGFIWLCFRLNHCSTPTIDWLNVVFPGKMGHLYAQRSFTNETSTVYWCIASKLKAARNLYWMSNMFLWVEIFLFFVCYHVFPKRHSQLDYELNDL